MSGSLSTAALKPKVFAPGANKLFGFDCTGMFPAGNLSSATVTCISAVQSGANGATGTVTTGDITIDAPVINIAGLTGDDGQPIAIGFGVQARIHGSSVDGANYELAVTPTDASGNTDTLFCLLQCRKTPPT
jgi:hypothetical protein